MTHPKHHSLPLFSLLIGICIALGISPSGVSAAGSSGGGARLQKAAAHSDSCPVAKAPRSLMLDGAFAPDAPTLAALRGTGARLFAGYLPSADAFHPWTAGDFARVRAAGYELVPVFVGPASGSNALRGLTDGLAAVAAARSMGLHAGPIALDVEPYALEDNPPGAVAYTRTWSAVVSKAGFSPWGYGVAAYFQDLADAGVAASLDVAWVALYPDIPPAQPDAHTVPGMPAAWTAPGTRIWQFAGSTTVDGASVDLSVADSGVSRRMRLGDC